ncbi:MAG: chromate transporter [Acidobacteriia bacterium]|nr:chromate transporter [Terriglobia bacterium]
MSDNRLIALALVFAPLSLVSFGGGQAIIADMQHQTVDIQHWMTGREFVDVFALSRAAPGPSTLIVALIGWQVAGFFGAVAATLAIYVPSSLVVYGAVRWWHASKDSPWRAVVERGLAPVAVGLVFAGALAVLQAAQVDALQIFTTVAATAVLLYTRVGMYTIMAVTAVIYVLVQFV